MWSAGNLPAVNKMESVLLLLHFSVFSYNILIPEMDAETVFLNLKTGIHCFIIILYLLLFSEKTKSIHLIITPFGVGSNVYYMYILYCYLQFNYMSIKSGVIGAIIVHVHAT